MTVASTPRARAVVTATDAELFAEAAAGDEAAFRVIFDRHVDAIRRYARARVAPEIADDVVAGTFAVAWSSRGTYDACADSCRPWLYGIASVLLKRHAAAERRWQNGLRHEALQATERGTTDDPGDGLVASDLRLAIARLSASEREVLLLVALGDLTVAAASRVIGISPVAARMRLHRARHQVAADLRRTRCEGGM